MGRALVICLLVVAVAAGCGSSAGSEGAGGSTSTTDTTPTTSVSSSTEPTTSTSTTVPAFVGSLERQTGAASGAGVASLKTVRIAHNAGFDRVVFEFVGQALPEWSVEYAKGPFTEDPSDRPLTVAGSSFLQLTMHGASGTDVDTGTPTYTGPASVAASGTTTVREAVRSGDFEAVMGWIIGLDHQAPFKVSTLSAPSRLVIDVAAP